MRKKSGQQVENKRRGLLRGNSGETMVEVLVSFLLLLLFLAVFDSSMRAATRFMRRAGEIRGEAYALSAALRPADGALPPGFTADKIVRYAFSAEEGGPPLFTIEASRGTVTVGNHAFPQFAAPSEGGG